MKPIVCSLCFSSLVMMWLALGCSSGGNPSRRIETAGTTAADPTAKIEQESLWVKGRVSGPNGLAVAEAAVALRWASSSKVEVHRTQLDGTFEFRRQVGKVAFTVTHASFQPVTLEAEVGPSESEVHVKMTDSAGYTFDGRISSRSVDVSVRLLFAPRDVRKDVFYVLPRNDGRVSVRLPEAEYLVVANGEDSVLSPVQFVSAGESFDIPVETVKYAGRSPRAVAMAELRRHAMPIAATEDRMVVDGSSLNLGGPNIWGIGEAVHGARESILLRIALTRVIANGQSAVVALEANWANVLAANEYVQGGGGDPTELASDLQFYMWRNREFVDVLRELRAYNKRHRHKIQLAGIDMQNPASNIAALDRCSVGKAVQDAAAWLVAPGNAQATSEELQRARNALLSILPPRTEARQLAVQACSRPYIRAGILALLQYIDIRSEGDWFGRQHARDRGMAANTLELVREGNSVVVWAHNGHVAKRGAEGAIPMGQILSEAPAVRYVVIGMVVGRGTFNSRSTSAGAPFIIAEFPQPSPENVAHTLEMISTSPFLLNLRGLPSGELYDWLSSPMVMWESGGQFQGVENSMGVRIPLQSYDVLTYVPRITPSRVLD